MYKIQKTIEISAAHSLDLPYESPCTQLHGHNWKIKVFLRSPKLTDYGMIVDFSLVKKVVKDKYDHRNLNDIVNISTAECMAQEIMLDISYALDKLNPDAKCYKVEVEECNGSIASYETPDYSKCQKCSK